MDTALARCAAMLTLALAHAATWAAEPGGPPIEWAGYLRAGTGTASKGGEQVCFALPGAPAKYRLGNECEVYSELVVGAGLYRFPDSDTTLKLHMRGSFYIPYSKLDVSDTTVKLPEAWIEAQALGTGPWAKASLWIGRRFYQRQDVHINDFFFWNNSGDGAGIENVDLGIGKFSYAIRRNSGDVVVGTSTVFALDPTTGVIGPTQVNRSANAWVWGHDLRLAMPVNPGGELTLGADLRQSRNTDAARASGVQDANGQMLNLMYTQTGFAGMPKSLNKLALQFGRGVLSNLIPTNPNLGAASGDKSWRLVEMLLYEPERGRWNGMATAIYERQVDKQKWLSLGMRPVYHFDDRWSIAVELGLDRVKPDQGPLRTLNKLTLAAQFSAGRDFFARPALRAFYTYAHWNAAAQAAASAGDPLSATGVFGGATRGSTVGVQLEAWW